MRTIEVKILREDPSIFISDKVDLMMRDRFGNNYLPKKTKKAVSSLVEEINISEDINGRKKWLILPEDEYMRKSRQLIVKGIPYLSMSEEINCQYNVYVFAIGWERSYEDQIEELLERSRKVERKVMV